MANEKNYGLRERTHDGVDRIMDKADSIGERGKKIMAGIKENAAKVNKNVDGYIKTNPKKSVLIAAGVGAVAGAVAATLIRRRKH